MRGEWGCILLLMIHHNWLWSFCLWCLGLTHFLPWWFLNLLSVRTPKLKLRVLRKLLFLRRRWNIKWLKLLLLYRSSMIFLSFSPRFLSIAHNSSLNDEIIVIIITEIDLRALLVILLSNLASTLTSFLCQIRAKTRLQLRLLLLVRAWLSP